MIITAVTMAKNEENLIESFVRHTMTFVDNLVIYDHNSTDGTTEILAALKKEFAARIVFWQEDEETLKIINQEVFNRMIRYAFGEMQSDMVMPLDADEFPVCPEKKDIRSYLEGLDKSKCYRTHFMPFAIPEQWRSDVFAPLLFSRRKKLNINTDFKTILHKEPYHHFGLWLSLGNHIVEATKNQKEELGMQDTFPNLFYVHLPFRSKAHLENKLVLRQLALAMRIDIEKGNAFQYMRGFDQIKEGQGISDEEADWYCLNNMCGGCNQTETLEEIQSSIERVDPYTLFDEIELKYTSLYSMQKTNYRMLLEFTEQLVDQYRDECKKYIDWEALQNEIIDREQKIAKLENEISLYANSTSWKITAPLRKGMMKLKRQKE